MNSETGQILTADEINRRNLTGEALRKFIPISAGEMTAKQRADKQVKLRDTRSFLGALRHKINGKKIGRNEPCPCGSGHKYKKCHGAGK